VSGGREKEISRFSPGGKGRSGGSKKHGGDLGDRKSCKTMPIDRGPLKPNAKGERETKTAGGGIRTEKCVRREGKEA